MKEERQVLYYFSGEGFEREQFGDRLAGMIHRIRRETGKRSLLFLCIGSDRSTGDSLGPLTGHFLKKEALYEGDDPVLVVGSLALPVHAVNLGAVLEVLEEEFPDYIVIAIDASIGSRNAVGYITLEEGSLKPGHGVSKNLKSVGDISITGIVSWGSCLQPALLQNIRLGMVMNMAGCICQGILRALQFSDEPDYEKGSEGFSRGQLC